ncbi:MAG: hypothetical protein LUH50_15095 [Bacteroides intestinalis]|nr:hypothetical protein [Bacteroides intestinalis]
MSQNDVADKLGVSKISIVRLEKGSVRSGFLIKALMFYSQYISLDRLFNEKMSIIECLQEEITLPKSELVKKRVSLIRETVNELFEDFRKEQNSKMDDILRRFNARMDAVDD